MQTDKPGFRTSFRITCVLLYMNMLHAIFIHNVVILQVLILNIFTSNCVYFYHKKQWIFFLVGIYYIPTFISDC